MSCPRKMLIPQLYLCLQEKYSLGKLQKDLIAGITVAVLTLSLCMEIAIASGVSPQVGLYSAIISGLIVSILGGSRVMISGPTPALIVIVYGMIQSLGYGAVCLSTLIASALLILFGALKIGSWIKLIPASLVIGFTSGLAVTLFSDQIKMFLGLPIDKLPVHFTGQITSYITTLPHLNIQTAVVGASTLAAIAILIKYFPRISWGITVITIISLIAYAFDLPIATIQSAFGDIPSNFPKPSLPDLQIPQGSIGRIIQGGVMMACIIGIESLLSCIIGKEITKNDYKPNIELIAQGLANAGILLFGGIPSSGLLLLTAANGKAGAKTPIAGIIRAVLLILILWLLAPIVSRIPLVALATVLMVVSIELFEVHMFIRFLKSPKTDLLVLLTSFTLTILANATTAVFVGIAIASILMITQMRKNRIPPVTNTGSDKANLRTYIFKMPTAFFFANADLLLKLPKHSAYIIDMEQTSILDASGILALENFYKDCKSKEIPLSILRMQKTIFCQAKRFGILKVISKESFID